MEHQAPSIFNDVIGPVMRGPSSSHVAGAARIGALLRQAAGGEHRSILCDFDINGSLAESHTGHGTDMGFTCGILNIPITDPRVDQYEQLLSDSGIDLEYRILDYGAEHPNHYRIFCTTTQGAQIRMDAISTGGGMIEVIALDEIPVSIMGDFYEYCFLVEGENVSAASSDHGFSGFEKLLSHSASGQTILECKCNRPQDPSLIDRLTTELHAKKCFVFEPVLPTQSTYQQSVPFRTAQELLTYNAQRQAPLWELALEYESLRGSTTKAVVWQKMREILAIMTQAVDTGLAGTVYADRILPTQSTHMLRPEIQSRLIPGDVMNTVIACITAVMESKSSMAVIVAAPTCGSCGCLPGTVIGIQRAMHLTEEDAIRGLLAAGMIGVFFAGQATFAAEVGGCQMECGAGSGMAAAAAAQMCGGTAEECLDAASMALQGLTGLACDPVANRVEVPCLNKNLVAGMNALSSSNVILAGFDKVIPLDEVILAMYDIGTKLPLELRCTFGGLGKTPTSLAIREELEKRRLAAARSEESSR